MGYKMIEITSEKKEELAENIEKALHYAGRAMSCVEAMAEGGQMGQRMGMREEDDYYPKHIGQRRYGMRDDMDDIEPYMGERRRYGMRRIGMRDPYYY